MTAVPVAAEIPADDEAAALGKAERAAAWRSELARWRSHDRLMLAAMAAAVAAAFLLRVRDDGRVYPVGLPERPLPDLCMAKVLTGFGCPGCGMTRSVIRFAAGDFADSWRWHRFGWLLVLIGLFQFPYRLLALRRPAWRYRLRPLTRLGGTVTVWALFLNWFAKMAGV